MKFFNIAILGFLPSTLLAASLPMPNEDSTLVKRDGAFSTCLEGDVSTMNGNEIWLHLNCKNKHGGTKWNNVELNKLIANQGGKLVWQRFCRLTNDGNTGIKYWKSLYLFCYNGHGGEVVATINLNEHFTNDDGDLIYSP
ncbi:hypothetical protein TWF694_005340 [Orbilia ellipsospora]|uniref:Cyanovirin-N domain-containing protein n=1 Tax=Orbilia ellipsospora TaxID=2528407 RepID=A0AAV9WSS9_9PEZI